jgi:hypothetical protein
MTDFLVGFTHDAVVILNIRACGDSIYSTYTLYDRRLLKYNKMEEYALEMLLDSITIEDILNNKSMDKNVKLSFENGEIDEEEVFKDFFAADLREPEKFFSGLWMDEGVLEDCAIMHKLEDRLVYQFMDDDHWKWLLKYANGEIKDKIEIVMELAEIEVRYGLDRNVMEIIENYVIE